MASNDYCLVFSAINNAAQAGIIADKAVEKRLAAAVNILDHMRSVYRWKGAVEKADELLMIFYTRAGLVESLAALIRELHPYELPGVTALDISKGEPDFLNWIGSNTASNMEDF